MAKRICEQLVFVLGIVSDHPTTPMLFAHCFVAETTFEVDEVTSQLENRFSGQGHRASLNRLHQYDDRWEAAHARFGEERVMYLQERGANIDNFIPSTTGKDRFRDQVLDGRGTAPRTSSGGHNFPDYGRVPPRAPDHTRAPSPRRFGTVRFAPGGQRSDQVPVGARTVRNPGTEAAAALRAFAAASTSTSNRFTALQDSVPAPSTNPAAVVPPKPAAAPAANPAAAPAANPAPSIPTMQHSPQTRPTKPVTDPYRAEKCHNRALWYAAHPEKCDKYYADHPDEKQYLGPAKLQLIKEAIRLAKGGDLEETKRYRDDHKERTWIVDGVMEAKKMVEEGTPKDIEAYCVASPRNKIFIEAAKANFAPKAASVANGGETPSIRGTKPGPYVVLAQNFAPGTTAADIESVMGEVTGQIMSCKLVASSPTVIAEISFAEKPGAEKVIDKFNGKKVGPTLA